MANWLRHLVDAYTTGATTGSTLALFGGKWTAQAPIVYLSGDIGNSANPAAWADVTGLSWSVASGATYTFEFYLTVTTAATTTRGIFGVNGPTTSLLVVNTQQNNASTNTGRQDNSSTAYDTAANVPAASPGTTAAPALVWGMLTTTAAGTLILRSKSNVNSSAVTVKAGSWGRLTRIA